MTVEAKVRITPELQGAINAIRGFAREFRGLTGDIEKADRSAKFTGAQAGLDALSGRIRTVHQQLLAFFGLQQGAQGIAAVARMSDEYQGMHARLRIVTQGQQEFNQSLATAKALATQYQGPLNETAALYTRLLSAVRPLGGGTREATVATEAMLAALKISGATAAESGSAILQYAQALGSGVLRGEEFNAINEAAPRLLDALAAGLGKPKSELKALAEQGQLTTSAVVKALRSQLPQLRAEAAQLPSTISGAAQQARDALQQFVGREMQGSARAMAEALKLVADNIQLIATALGVLAAVLTATALGRMAAGIAGVITGMGGATTAAALLTRGLGALLALVGGPVGLVVTVLALAAAWVTLGNAKRSAQERTTDDIRNERQAVLQEIEDLRTGKAGVSPDRYLQQITDARRRLRALDAEMAERGQQATSQNYRTRYDEDNAGLRDPAAIKKFEDEYKLRADIVKKFADERATYVAAKDKEIAAARARNDAAETAKLTAQKADYLKEQARSEREALKSFDTRDALTRLVQAKQLYDKDFELLADMAQREAKLLQDRWDQGLIGLRDYLEEKARLQDEEAGRDIERLTRQRAEEQRALAQNRAVLQIAKDPNARDSAREAVQEAEKRIAQLDAEIVKKERDRVDNARALTTEARNLTRELQLQADALDAEIRQANGTDTPERVAERTRRARAQAGIDFAKQGGDPALFEQNTQVAIRRGVIQLQQQDLARARTELSQREEEARTLESAGAITAEEAERRVLEARRAQIPVLQEIIAKLQALAVSPEEQAQARAAQLEVQRLGDLRTEAQKTLQAQAKTGFGTFFTDVLSGARTVQDALRNMLASFAQQMLNLIGQRLGARLFESFGMGKVIDTAISFLGFHEGGIIGGADASFRRTLNVGPLAAALAPRYHTGGIIGLKPRERMVVAEEGEEMLTADNPRHIRNFRGGGMQAQVNVTVNGASGDEQQLQSAGEGLGVVVNGAIEAWAMRESRPGGVLYKGA